MFSNIKQYGIFNLLIWLSEGIIMSRESNKRAKFVELAEKRVNRAIQSIKLVGNLANKTNYKYEDEDVRQIMSILRAELEELKRKFSSDGKGAAAQFRLTGKNTNEK